MKFSKELQDLFLQGAQVVCKEIDYSRKRNTQVYILRMPKGFFIQDTRKGQEDNLFEFVRVEDFIEKGLIQVSGHRNGTLSEVRKNILN